ncbi:MAG: MlaD family protein [Candidatus Symbiothrix sp.]|jgi:phospholipid/cholesterol/gamma-HCH transport system substrate-binding protein|nr:MlaD family protein [Candidatus Symbiothrix sp.]
MKKIFSKEVIIGIVTLVSLFLLYWGLNYMKGINLFKPTNHYYVLMPNVSELQNSSPVFVDGFKVGIVNDIEYEFTNPDADNIVVQISLDKDMKVQSGSYAELKSGLTSGAYLNLVLNKYVSAYYQVGDTLEGITNAGLMDKLSADLLPQIEKILPRLDSILSGIQTLVNHPALTQSLDHIEGTTANLQKSSDRLNALLSKDVPVIVSNLNKVSSDFTVVSDNLKQVDVQSTLNTVDQAMQNINQMSKQLNNPDNTLGLFLNDRSLYDQLDSTARNASNLLLDIKEHPKNYVHFSVF